MQLTGRSPYTQTGGNINRSTTDAASASAQDSRAQRTPSKSERLTDDSLKRKHLVVKEEFPSSSPIQDTLSPKRRRHSGSELLREIASTPEGSPDPSNERSFSPLFVEIKDESDENDACIDNNFHEGQSPLGQAPSETLSEPQYGIRHTQVPYRSPTLSIDFEVPPPDEGWNENQSGDRETIDPNLSLSKGRWKDEDSGVEASKPGSESESSATEDHNLLRAMRSETQAIFQTQTQLPDFDVAEPEGGWDFNPTDPAAPSMPETPYAETDASDVDVQTDAWIDALVAEGFPEEQVTRALKCCTMDTSLAKVALKHLGCEGQFPENMRGVWTESDDQGLASTDARTIQKLEQKHGPDGITARWDFLSFMGHD